MDKGKHVEIEENPLYDSTYDKGKAVEVEVDDEPIIISDSEDSSDIGDDMAHLSMHIRMKEYCMKYLRLRIQFMKDLGIYNDPTITIHTKENSYLLDVKYKKSDGSPYVTEGWREIVKNEGLKVGDSVILYDSCEEFGLLYLIKMPKEKPIGCSEDAKKKKETKKRN